MGSPFILSKQKFATRISTGVVHDIKIVLGPTAQESRECTVGMHYNNLLFINLLYIYSSCKLDIGTPSVIKYILSDCSIKVFCCSEEYQEFTVFVNTSYYTKIKFSTRVGM